MGASAHPLILKLHDIRPLFGEVMFCIYFCYEPTIIPSFGQVLYLEDPPTRIQS